MPSSHATFGVNGNHKKRRKTIERERAQRWRQGKPSDDLMSGVRFNEERNKQDKTGLFILN